MTPKTDTPAPSLAEVLESLIECYPPNHMTGVAIREAKAEIERLQAALRKAGVVDCEVTIGKPCTCGLDEARGEA